MSLPYRPLLLALFVLLGGATGLASAQAVPQKDRGYEKDSSHDERHRRRSALSDSVRRIERETRGQVLSAERLQYDGRELNRVKVVDGNGRVRVYVDDPAKRGRGDDARTRRDDEGEPNL
ncbi:hypothetical protein IP90_02159 [Luteimonas cucumeris]|uniref:YpeB-like protein with protease inhibitory function n=2 Tax=Luteimonas cucumeris TaxID=985012 RepID=A0A562L624_9GAMM|nr:hypothetical protein IP90_02159 [Luteimonas cucumeris]